MKKLISIILIFTLVGIPSIFSFASSDNNDLSWIDIRPKHDKAMPGDDSLYYGLIYLNENFSTDVLNYTADVEYSITNVKIEADVRGSVTVTGNRDYDLNVGKNTILLTVTKPDSTQKTYTLIITRAQNPDDITDISGFEMQTFYGARERIETTPLFSPDVTDYGANVKNEIDTIEIAYIFNDTPFYKPYKLKTGSNTIIITVTSKSGLTKNYTFNVYREKSSDNELTKLSVNGTEVSQGESGNFAQNVSYDVNKANILVTYNSTAKASITGPDKLQIGSNKFTITVTAENGQSKPYILVVNRGKPSVKLGSLQINEYICGVDNDPYILDVNNSTYTVKITAKAYDFKSAKVTGNGTYKLKLGKNTFSVNVKSASGNTKKYKIIVNRSKYKEVKIKIYWTIE